MNPDEHEMLVYMYRRAKFHSAMWRALVLVSLIAGGVWANVWMYEHGWK